MLDLPTPVAPLPLRPPAAAAVTASTVTELLIAGGQRPGGARAQVAPHGVPAPASGAGSGADPGHRPEMQASEAELPPSKGNGAGSTHLRPPVSSFAAELAVPASGKWLIAPRPNPGAKARLFCFPYAGGGVVSFRTWPQWLDAAVEL